jgi:hypothetical protein
MGGLGCGVRLVRDSGGVAGLQEVITMRLKRRSSDVPETAPATVADARTLALEYAALHPPESHDPELLGVVLRPGETIRRSVPAWFRIRVEGQWSHTSQSHVMVTDRRLIVRLGSGELASLWWGSVCGFEADLGQGHVVLDFGDGRPRLLSGDSAPVIAVGAVAGIYGVPSLASHPCLEALRTR